jgi:hypothetical protein
MVRTRGPTCAPTTSCASVKLGRSLGTAWGGAHRLRRRAVARPCKARAATRRRVGRPRQPRRAAAAALRPAAALAPPAAPPSTRAAAAARRPGRQRRRPAAAAAAPWRATGPRRRCRTGGVRAAECTAARRSFAPGCCRKAAGAQRRQRRERGVCSQRGPCGEASCAAQPRAHPTLRDGAATLAPLRARVYSPRARLGRCCGATQQGARAQAAPGARPDDGPTRPKPVQRAHTPARPSPPHPQQLWPPSAPTSVSLPRPRLALPTARRRLALVPRWACATSSFRQRSRSPWRRRRGARPSRAPTTCTSWTPLRHAPGLSLP